MKFTKALLVLLTFSLIMPFCGKKDKGSDTPPVPEGTFTTDRTSYNPYQMMVVQVKKHDQPAGTKIIATLGSKTVDAVIVTDTTVLLMTPAAPGASQALSFTLKGIAYKGNVTINDEAAVAAPNEYLTTFSTSITASLDLLKSQVQSDATLEEKEELYASIEAAKDSVAVFNSRMAALTEAERAYIANFIKANYERRPKFPSGLNAAMLERRTGVDGSFFDEAGLCSTNDPVWNYHCSWNQFITGVSEMSQWLVLTYASAVPIQIAFPGIGTALATVGTVMVVVELNNVIVFGKKVFKAKLVRAWEKGVSIYNSTSEYFKSVNVKGSMTELKKDLATSFSFMSKFRTVEEADNASGIDFLESGLSKINTYNNLVGKLGDKFKVKFEAKGSVYRVPAEKSMLSIQVVNNSKVTVKSFSGTPDKLDVIFTTTEGTDQEFEYDVVYNSGIYPEVRVRHKAKLLLPFYKLATNTGILITTELNFDKDVAQLFKLVNEDGTPATDVVYNNISIANNTNSKVTVNPTYGTTGFNLALSSTSTDAQKTSFDILYQSKKVQTVTASLNDSLEFYKRAVIGTWELAWNGEYSDVSEYIITETGKGYASQTTSSTGTYTIPAWDYYNVVTWRVSRLQGGGYGFYFSHDNRNIGFGGPVTYPALQFKSYPVIGSTSSWVIGRKK